MSATTTTSSPRPASSPLVRADGHREVLGFSAGEQKTRPFGARSSRAFAGAGLRVVRLVISDQHAGLVAAFTRTMQCVAHQAAGSISNIAEGVWRIRPDFGGSIAKSQLDPGAAGECFHYA
jgi:hypothetical protein